MTDDRGERISYLVLEVGTPCYTSDGEAIGRVKRVLAAPEEDVYDGLILATDEGDRFVDADHASELYEHAVVLSIPADQVHHLPDPTANPAAMAVEPDDTVHHSAGQELGHLLRRAWDRISGNY
jgi:sporulation protein YlmC with PRC-barrel domain